MSSITKLCIGRDPTDCDVSLLARTLPKAVARQKDHRLGTNNAPFRSLLPWSGPLGKRGNRTHINPPIPRPTFFASTKQKTSSITSTSKTQYFPEAQIPEHQQASWETAIAHVETVRSLLLFNIEKCSTDLSDTQAPAVRAVPARSESFTVDATIIALRRFEKPCVSFATGDLGRDTWLWFEGKFQFQQRGVFADALYLMDDIAILDLQKFSIALTTFWFILFIYQLSSLPPVLLDSLLYIASLYTGILLAARPNISSYIKSPLSETLYNQTRTRATQLQLISTSGRQFVPVIFREGFAVTFCKSLWTFRSMPYSQPHQNAVNISPLPVIMLRLLQSHILPSSSDWFPTSAPKMVQYLPVSISL